MLILDLKVDGPGVKIHPVFSSSTVMKTRNLFNSPYYHGSFGTKQCEFSFLLKVMELVLAGFQVMTNQQSKDHTLP